MARYEREPRDGPPGAWRAHRGRAAGDPARAGHVRPAAPLEHAPGRLLHLQPRDRAARHARPARASWPCAWRPADERVASALGVAARDARRRAQPASGSPTTSPLVDRDAATCPPTGSRGSSGSTSRGVRLYDTLTTRYGVRPVRAREAFEPVLLTAAEARAAGAAPRRPGAARRADRVRRRRRHRGVLPQHGARRPLPLQRGAARAVSRARRRRPAAAGAPGARDGRADRPRYPVISMHEHLGPVFGGDWRHRPVAELLAAMDAGGHRHAGRPRWRAGRHAVTRRSSDTRRRIPTGSVVFAGLDYEAWATEPAFGELEAERLRDSVARGARGLKVWKLLGLRARDPDGSARGGGRRAPRPAVAGRGASSGCRCSSTSPTPSRSSSRWMTRNERVEELRAAPGLALLAAGDGARRRRATRASTSCWPRFDRLRRHATPASTFIGRPRRLRVGGPRLRGRDARAAPQPVRGHRGPARRSSAGSPYTARRFFLDWRTASCSAPTARWTCATCRLYYRFLETFDDSFDYSPEPVPPQGRWRISGLGPARRCATACLHRERAAHPGPRQGRRHGGSGRVSQPRARRDRQPTRRVGTARRRMGPPARPAGARRAGRGHRLRHVVVHGDVLRRAT